MDKKSKLGYSKNSPYKNEPYIDIQGNEITMENTEFPIIAIPNNDKPVVMQPGKNYKFKNSQVIREIPLHKAGGSMVGMSGETKHPVSPFIDLKPFIKKYKLQKGGVYDPMLDYLSTLVPEVQLEFANDFDSLSSEEQNEVVLYLKGGYYQTGGVNEYQSGGQPNAELENKESILTPNGQLSQVKGKTHKEGGIEVNLPNGSRIYSEYLIAPPEVVKQVTGKETKKKYSYADLSKKFPTEPYLETIEEDADQYQVEGAKIKLANNLAKLDTIFYAQEQEKKQGEDFKCGGMKYQQGGWVTPRLPRPNSGVKQPVTPIDWTFLTGLNVGQIPMDAQQGDYQYDYPVIHTEPSPTVSTGVVLPRPRTLDLSRIQQTSIIDETPVQQTQATNTVQQVPRRRRVSNRTKPVTTAATPVVPESTTPKWTPFPNFDTLPQRTPLLTPTPAQSINEEVTQDAADYIMEQSDDKSYKGSPKERNPFGISNELAGTVADIGLALSDKLTVREPTLYNRQKTPIFTRFVDFDDQDVARTYSLRTQQIQNSNMPEQVKQAQLSSLNSEYQDYQAKVDFANLQRYEQKRERDTDKLQSYMDRNIDIKVEDLDSYQQRKARVDDLRSMYQSRRKENVVNALKKYANFVDETRYKNQLIDNYELNPITGNIQFKEKPQSDLRTNILQQYQQRTTNKVDLGNGLTGTIVGNKMVVSNPDGSKFETVTIE